MLNIVILDDYQDTVRKLQCAAHLDGFNAKVYTNTVKGVGQLAVRLRDADVIVLIRERTPLSRQLIEKLPKLKLIKDLGNLAVHSNKPISARDAVAALRELFHFGYWLARTYGQRSRPDPDLRFSADQLPKAAQPKVPAGVHLEGCVHLDPTVKLPSYATIIGPVWIGARTEIRPGAFIRGNVIVGEDGVLVGVKCCEVDDRRKPIAGTEFVIRADLAFIAIGFAAQLIDGAETIRRDGRAACFEK